MTLQIASFQRSLEPKLVEIWKNYWHVSDIKIIQTTRKSNFFSFIRPYKGKVVGFSNSLNDFSV
eukprot:UN20569